MSSAAATNQLKQLPARHLYMRLLRSAYRFPSVKRQSIIKDIREDFRTNRHVSDPAKLERMREEAYTALVQMDRFATANNVVFKYEQVGEFEEDNKFSDVVPSSFSSPSPNQGSR
ncbi:hypothetical protein QOT17_003576 [Balamuthia mandrillaris]